MREIKFRAFDKAKGIMFDVKDMQFTGGKIHCCSAGDEDNCIIGYVGDHLELMQFTGIKDKNGIEVYECDILENKKHGGRWIVQFGVVNFDYCGFTLKALCKERDDNLMFFKSNYENLEVIGNIYEIQEQLTTPTSMQE